MLTTQGSLSKSAMTELVTVMFGSTGSSWFAVRERTDKKLKGYRWNANYGNWGPYVTLSTKVLTNKIPVRACGDLPTQSHIEAEDKRLEARLEQGRRRKTWVKRLLKGERIPVKGKSGVNGEIVSKNGPRGFLVEWANGNQGWQSGEYLEERV
mgnify:FL=1